MYTELILRSKSMGGERIYPDESRLLVSEALTGKEVDPMLFGRQKDGKTHGDLVNRQSPLAPIMFDGGKGFVRIYAVGKAGIDMLNANIGTIYDAMTTHSKTPIVMEIKSGNLEYRPKGDCVYRIPKLAPAKRHKIRGQRFFEAYDR